jgi:hypothetical protein
MHYASVSTIINFGVVVIQIPQAEVTFILVPELG